MNSQRACHASSVRPGASVSWVPGVLSSPGRPVGNAMSGTAGVGEFDLRERLQAALGAAYALGRELGGGGMARVFVAEETALGRTVVVKVLPPELAGEVSAGRLKREVQFAAQLR